MFDSKPKLPMDPEHHDQFVVLYVRHQIAIHSFIFSLLPNSVDAEEVLQETSLVMWRRFAQYQAGSNFRNWAFQIAKYTALNYRRKCDRDRHLFSEKIMGLLAERAKEISVDVEAELRVLDHCIARLEDNDQQLLKDCYAEGVTIKAYAEKTLQTANVVYKRLNRVRAKLLTCIQRTLAVEGNV